MKRSRGFTLIELMIVVAIIAILASIAVTVYFGSVAKAQLTEAISVADSLKTAVADYQHETGVCPTAGVGGILSPSSYAGRFVSGAKVTGGSGNCVITATMKNNSVSSRIQGKSVSLTMTSNDATAIWKCTSTAAAIYLPKTCK